jgi:hypothetical protein
MVVAERNSGGIGKDGRLQDEAYIYNGFADTALRKVAYFQQPVGAAQKQYFKKFPVFDAGRIKYTVFP